MICHALSVQPATRIAQGALAAALLSAAVIAVATTAATWGWVAGAAIGPDIALLFAFGRGLAPGQIHRRAVPLYNALHHPVGPLGVGALALVGVVGPGPAAAALAWGFHIAMDRAAGYGLRTRDGHQRT